MCSTMLARQRLPQATGHEYYGNWKKRRLISLGPMTAASGKRSIASAARLRNKHYWRKHAAAVGLKRHDVDISIETEERRTCP